VAWGLCLDVHPHINANRGTRDADDGAARQTTGARTLTTTAFLENRAVRREVRWLGKLRRLSRMRRRM
jgi:hypothetical protein